MRNPFRRRAARTISRLGKDEDGAVMVITVILGMLLFKAVLSTYNVGVLAAEKMRLQMTADAAAYSAAVWQARFLNYCAYVRRAAIANYAHVGYITAMEAHFPHMKKYDDLDTEAANCLGIPGDDVDPDHGVIQLAADLLVPTYEQVKNRLVDGGREQTAQSLTKSHADVAKAMYDFVKKPSVIAEDIVEQMNLPIDGHELAQIKVCKPAMDRLEDGSMQGVLNDNWIELIPLKDLEDDIKARFDVYTVGDWDPTVFDFLPLSTFHLRGHAPFAPSDAPGLWMARPYNSAYIVPDPLYTGLDVIQAITCQNSWCDSDRYYVSHINVKADPMEIDWSGGEFKTKDFDAFGRYYVGTLPIPIPFTSICAPITFYSAVDDDEENEGESDVSKHEDIELYNIKATDPEHLEPSVYVALEIDRTEFVGAGADEADPEGAKRLLHHRGIPLARGAKTMTAVARAKVAFQSMNSDHRFYKPNLYYPYWEAVLAPIYGPGRDNCTATLRNNGDAILRKAIEGKNLRLDSNADFEEYADGIHF